MLIDREQTIETITMELDMIDHVPQWVFERLTRAVGKVPSAEPNVLDDGTLTITVPHGMLSKVNRVIVDEVGTKFCKMMYQDALPSAERVGKWEYGGRNIYGYDYYFCSECGYSSVMPGWDYCPNCGARMMSEDDSR